MSGTRTADRYADVCRTRGRTQIRSRAYAQQPARRSARAAGRPCAMQRGHMRDRRLGARVARPRAACKRACLGGACLADILRQRFGHRALIYVGDDGTHRWSLFDTPVADRRRLMLAVLHGDGANTGAHAPRPRTVSAWLSFRLARECACPQAHTNIHPGGPDGHSPSHRAPSQRRSVEGNPQRD